MPPREIKEGSRWRVKSAHPVGHIEPGELVYVRNAEFQGQIVIEAIDDATVKRAVGVAPGQFRALLKAAR